MSDEDKDPRSTMSRSKGDGKVMSGGRKIKYHHSFPSVHRDTWPTNPDDFLDPPATKPTTQSTKKKRVPKDRSAKSKKDRQQSTSIDHSALRSQSQTITVLVP